MCMRKQHLYNFFHKSFNRLDLKYEALEIFSMSLFERFILARVLCETVETVLHRGPETHLKDCQHGTKLDLCGKITF